MSKVCDPLFKKKVKSNDSIKNKNTDQPWYDDDCKSKRKYFYKNLNFYRNDKCEGYRISMTAARSSYKCAIRSNKFKYDKMRTSKLERARFQNTKEYWKMLKGLTENSTVKLFQRMFLLITLKPSMIQTMYFFNRTMMQFYLTKDMSTQNFK